MGQKSFCDESQFFSQRENLVLENYDSLLRVELSVQRANYLSFPRMSGQGAENLRKENRHVPESEKGLRC